MRNILLQFAFAFGSFSSAVLQCAVLQNPADGSVQVSGNTVGSQAIYTCNPGFILSQDVTRTCLETEVWSGVNPECGGIE